MALCSDIKRYISQLAVVQKTSAKLLNCILCCFACLAPCWSFWFIKTPESKMAESKMAEMYVTLESMELKVIPNPFSEKPNENNPTSTQRNGSEATINFVKHLSTQ